MILFYCILVYFILVDFVWFNFVGCLFVWLVGRSLVFVVVAWAGSFPDWLVFWLKVRFVDSFGSLFDSFGSSVVSLADGLIFSLLFDFLFCLIFMWFCVSFFSFEWWIR